MIHLDSEQINVHLTKKLHRFYLIFGNDLFLIQESIDKISQIAKKKGFKECYNYRLDVRTDWNKIYRLTQSTSLFSSRQILILILPENGLSMTIIEKLLNLTKCLHPDLLLILCGKKLTKSQENSNWFKEISQKAIYIHCLTPKTSKLTKWIGKRTKEMSITLDKESNQLLCYYYEENLLALNQILKQLSLLYPDGNLTFPRVKKVVNSAVNFTPYHWIDALLSGNIKRSWHIIQKLKYENYETIILLRTIQREVLLLLMLKEKNNNENLKELFNRYKIWPVRYSLICSALQRLSTCELHNAIQLIVQSELDVKQNHNLLIWLNLETLSILFCGKSVPKIFINDSLN